jgi:hypothetical protein
MAKQRKPKQKTMALWRKPQHAMRMNLLLADTIALLNQTGAFKIILNDRNGLKEQKNAELKELLGEYYLRNT